MNKLNINFFNLNNYFVTNRFRSLNQLVIIDLTSEKCAFPNALNFIKLQCVLENGIASYT